MLENQDLDGFPLARNEQISSVLVCARASEYITHNKATRGRSRDYCGEYSLRGVQPNILNQLDVQKLDFVMPSRTSTETLWVRACSSRTCVADLRKCEL